MVILLINLFNFQRELMNSELYFNFLQIICRVGSICYENRSIMQGCNKSQKGEIPEFTQEDGIQKLLNESALNKFIGYMTQFRNNHLKEGVKNIYGRHYAVNFSPEYQFKQQWETKKKQYEENNYYEIIQSQALVGYIYTIIYLLFQIFLLWYFTSFRLLALIQLEYATIVISMAIVATIIDSSIKFYLKFIKTGAFIERKDVFETFRGNMVLLLYYFLNLILINEGIFQESNLVMYMIDFMAIWQIYKRASGLFFHFKIRSYTTAYKNYFKILDLFSNILLIEHIFALFVYLVSFYDANSNWLMHYGHSDATNMERYYYSVYFTSTTIFTIGYGDILPINDMEIFCVLIMQMFGVANFSYLINEIGYTISTIRKEEEQLEHNISTLSKMCKYYKVEPDLQNLAKEYILNNKKSFDHIVPEQENKVLMKLNDDLREALTHENNLSIIKSSVFFLCHWTKSFQLEIAKRLVKKILIPNQMVIQVSGKEKIYIIKSGKLQVYTNTSYGYKKNFKKLLKTIEPKAGTEISDNVYGYSSVISNKPVKINAISKDFTCVYYIDKNNFLECVHENKLDIQYYFEVKTKLDCTKHIQSFQTPAVLNIRQHYRPIEIFLIKKHVHRMKKFTNSRRDYLRHERGDLISTTKIFNKWEDQAQRSPTSNQIRLTYFQAEQNSVNHAPRMSFREETNNTGVKDQYEPSKEMMIISKFEVMKEYSKYFKRFNISNVILRTEKENYISTSYVEPCQYLQSDFSYAFNKLRKVAPSRHIPKK